MEKENYLVHHGINGQKWGVRRYQNPDGTLTAAGRERYRVSDATKLSYSKKMDKLYRKENRSEKEEKTLRRLENGKKYVENNGGALPFGDFFNKERRQNYKDGQEWLRSTNWYKGSVKAVLIGQFVGGIPGNIIADTIYRAKNERAYVNELQEARKKREEDERYNR